VPELVTTGISLLISADESTANGMSKSSKWSLNKAQLYGIPAKYLAESAPIKRRWLIFFSFPPSYSFYVESGILAVFGTESQNALGESLL
jgi:hypothetical protein